MKAGEAKLYTKRLKKIPGNVKEWNIAQNCEQKISKKIYAREI